MKKEAIRSAASPIHSQYCQLVYSVWGLVRWVNLVRLDILGFREWFYSDFVVVVVVVSFAAPSVRTVPLLCKSVISIPQSYSDWKREKWKERPVRGEFCRTARNFQSGTFYPIAAPQIQWLYSDQEIMTCPKDGEKNTEGLFCIAYIASIHPCQEVQL